MLAFWIQLSGLGQQFGGEAAHSIPTTPGENQVRAVGDSRERCAVTSLAMCLRMIGAEPETVRLVEGTGLNGAETSLKDCIDLAQKHGFSSAGIRWDKSMSGIRLTETPAIVPMVLRDGSRHFVAAVDARSDSLLVVDYPFPPRWMSGSDLQKSFKWDGTMLHIAKNQVALKVLADAAARRRFSPFFTVLGSVMIALTSLYSGWRLRRGSLRSQSPRELGRGGFTIIELLVSLAIISLLVGLLLPAIQSAREAARRTTCINRLHQIGIAAGSFESSRGRHPAGSVSSSRSNGTQITENMAAQVELLPFLDQSALFHKFNRAETGSGINDDPPSSPFNGGLLLTGLDAFICPSDFGPGARCNFRISAGTSPWMHETIPKSPSAALQGYRSLLGRKDAEFPDGKSNTTAFSEKLVGDRDSSQYTPWRDLASINFGPPGLMTPDDAMKACGHPLNPQPKHFSFGGTTWGLSGYPQTWYNHVLSPNSSTPDCVDGGPMGHGAFTARSMHIGIVNVLFADGHVHSTANDIDLDVWRAIGSVAGGEIVSEGY